MSVRTLAGDIEAQAARDPDRVALIAGEHSVTYGELAERSRGFAAGLAQAGVGRGDRVALVLPNGIPAAVAIAGVLRAGAALSPLNPTIKHDRLRFVLEDIRPALAVCDTQHETMVSGAAEDAGDVGVVADVEELSASTGPVPRPPLGTDLAAVLYTSGSTGQPKGVMLTHHNMAFAMDSIIEYLELTGDDRVLCLLQLSFGYGLTQLMPSLRVGGSVVIEDGIAFPGRIVQALERHEVTGMAGVPTIFQVLSSLDGLAERSLPRLRYLTNAGASLPAATVANVRRTFPNASLYLMYGLTECLRVSYLPPAELERRPTSSGIPMPGTYAWVDGSGGGEAGVGEVGELLVRGPHVMQGYWEDRERTADRLRPGRWPWERVLATGDLFRRDEDGFLHWVGRTDDLIKCRGEKVYPREVEEVLHDADGVREAAVVGVEDRLLGQAVIAHAAPEPGHELDPRALRRHCAERLEDHKIPKRVVVHQELPRNPRGKVDRAALLAASDGGPA